MASVLKLLWSSIGKKFIMGLSGFFLCLFVIVHLLGNLQLFSSNPEFFNAYAHKFRQLGNLLYLIEFILLAIFLFHTIAAIAVYWQNKTARPVAYSVKKKGGKASRASVASSSMILTGGILFVFMIWHLYAFRFGPGIDEGYVAHVHGQKVIDLYRVVSDFFSHGWNVFLYTSIMILLGLHLSHGSWSYLQSLGLEHPRISPIIYGIGLIFALLISLGFLAIPLYLYFAGGAG
ncbi:MAG: succinate dehydrogenase cytochrome b subunit [Chlamydiota bacterium]|nr:succinate dehydrogenase cytochrome b subunit [Chlamydiota bacterium]